MNTKERAFIRAAGAAAKSLHRSDYYEDMIGYIHAMAREAEALGPSGVEALCEEKTCKWTRNVEGDGYKTKCGEFATEYSGLYCTHCAGKVEVVR
jgi:hypothetical protein